MSRRLRIALVVPGFPRTAGEPGMPAVVDLVSRLAAEADVRMVSLRHPPRQPPYHLSGAEVRALGFGAAGGLAARGRVLAAGIRAVVATHRRSPVDVVHGLWLDEPGAVAALAGRLIGRPSVASLLGGELVALADIGYGAALGRGGRWAVATTLRLADLVTAPTTSGLDAVAARRRRAAVLRPLGVDTTLFRPPDAVPVTPAAEILVVGSHEPVKDPLLALRAFARVAADRPGLRLTFIGDGSLRPAVGDEAAALGLGGRVNLTGYLDRADVARRYRVAAALLVASRHEGQSMVAVEAASSGLPIVGLPVGVLPALGPAARTAAATAATAAAAERALAEALAAVVDDPALRARMGAAGRARAVADFDLGVTVPSLLDDYRRLTSGHGAGARAGRRR